MWYNVFIKWVLRSPLHGVLSANMVLVSYAGRKSGKLYDTPVNYVRDGDSLTITSYRERRWWRNLVGGAPVTLRLQGHDVKGMANAIVGDPQAIANELYGYLQKAPGVAKYFGVSLGSEGKPIYEDVVRAAQDRIVVKVQLN